MRRTPFARLRNPDLLIAGLLFLLPLLFFLPVTLGGRTLIPADNLYTFAPWSAYRAQVGAPEVPHNLLVSDLVLENYVWKRFTINSLAGGELPLWNPYLFAGVPFLAAGQHSALYPFSLIYYLLPLENAYGWFTVSQLWLAGLFMYLFVRGLGLRRGPALIGGVAFQLSSFFLASVVFQMIIAAAAWLPFVLLMTENTLRRRPVFGRPAVVPWVALGAFGLAMTILAGHVEFVYYTLLVAGFWSAWRLIGLILTRREVALSVRLADAVRLGVALLIMVALGVGLGAVQFIPTVELANISSREGRSTFDQVRGYGFPPRQALGFLMPNFFGSPAQHDYFDLFTGQTVPFRWTNADGVTITDTMMPGGKNYVEGASYVGILTLALAGIALLARRRVGQGGGPYRPMLAALSLISVLFIFGTPAYAILYYGLPGINQLHSPFRWVFPLTLCLAVLAAFGAERLLPRDGEASGEEPGLARIVGLIGPALIGLGALVLIGLLISRLAFDGLRGPITSLYNALAGANLAYPSVEVFYSVRFRDVLILGVMLLASGLVIALARRVRTPGTAWRWQALAVTVLAADLMIASAGFNPAADPAWLRFEPPSVAWLKAQNPAAWRLTAIYGQSAVLNANTAWLHDLQDIRGYDSIIPRQYVQYMERVAPQDQLLFNRIAPIFPWTLDSTNWARLDLLSVRYIMAEVNGPTLDPARFPQFRIAYEDEVVRIYENTAALPRAVVIAPPDEATASESPRIERIEGATAQITRAGNIELTVDVTVPGDAGPAQLLITDTYLPGWRAYVRPFQAAPEAEIETPIQLAYGNFRAVDLAPGEWTVRFRYSPPSFQVGAFTTFLSLVALLFAIMLWLWQRFYREAEGDESGVRRFAKNSLAPIGLNLFNRLIDLAFAFIMLRLLGPAGAGTYYYAVVIFGWFDILTNFGLNTLLTREVARDRAAAGRYLLNSSLLRLGLAALGVPLLIGFLLIRSGLQPPLDTTAIAAILLLYVGLIPNSISTGLSALFYAFEKAEVPAAISTVTAILKAAAGLGALLAGWGVIGLAGVSIGLNLVTLALLAWTARSTLRTASETTADRTESRAIDGSLMRGMMIAGWPLMLNHLLATIFFKIDVVILEPLQGAAVVGQYSTAYKWVDALGVVPSLFTMALLPIMARQAHEDKAALERGYHFAVKLLFSLALPVAIGTTFAAFFLINLLGGARFLPDGAIALQVMIWFIPIGWINSLTNYVLIALDQQRRMRFAFLAGVSFNIAANLILIPIFGRFGYVAAAAVTILSEAVLLAGFYALLRQALAPVPWLRLLWKPLVAGAAMFGVLLALWPLAPLLALIAAGGVYSALLFALRPFSAWERGRFAPLLPNRLRRLVIGTAKG